MSMSNFLQQLPTQIDELDYVSLTDSELEKAKQRQAFAEHNLRLEALYLTADEKQFIHTLLDKKLPFDRQKPFIDVFLQQILSDKDYQKYQNPTQKHSSYETWADYFEPSTDEQVLKNRFGTNNNQALESIERIWVALRHHNMPDISFDSTGLQQLHQHLFGDMYAWAGQFRQVSMGKGDKAFVKPALIQRQLDQVFNHLAKDNFLQGLDLSTFCQKLAQLLGDINNIHPFRDGNGRTTRAFVWLLAQRAGYTLDFSYITQERMIQASIDYANGDPAKMHAIIDEITNPEAVMMASSFHQFLQQARGLATWNGLFIANMQHGKTYEGTFIGQNSHNFTLQLVDSTIMVGDVNLLKKLGKNYRSGDKIMVAM